MRRALATVLLLAGVLAGCEDDLPKATEIARMRVLGAQLSVVGDETRSTPAPGETLDVAFPTVFPTLKENTRGAQTLLIGCTGPDRYTGGLPLCQEFVNAALTGEGALADLPMLTDRVGCDIIDSLPPMYRKDGALSVQCVDGDPRAQFEVPEDFEGDELLFLGVMCEQGEAVIDLNDPLLFSCDGNDGETIRMHGLAPVQRDAEEENHNPDIDALTITREGIEWFAYDPALLPTEDNCEVVTPKPFNDFDLDGKADEDSDGMRDPDVDYDVDPAVHSVVPGAHKITLSYPTDAREEFEGEPENLEITVYTTLGEMERRFTVFEGDETGEDGVLEAELDWEPPAPTEVLPAGELVRFFITLRDQRGGFAITQRALCLR